MKTRASCAKSTLVYLVTVTDEADALIGVGFKGNRGCGGDGAGTGDEEGDFAEGGGLEVVDEDGGGARDSEEGLVLTGTEGRSGADTEAAAEVGADGIGGKARPGGFW